MEGTSRFIADFEGSQDDKNSQIASIQPCSALLWVSLLCKFLVKQDASTDQFGSTKHFWMRTQPPSQTYAALTPGLGACTRQGWLPAPGSRPGALPPYPASLPSEDPEGQSCPLLVGSCTSSFWAAPPPCPGTSQVQELVPREPSGLPRTEEDGGI